MKHKLLARLVARNEYRGLDATKFGREQLRRRLWAAMTRVIKLEFTFAGADSFGLAWERGEFHQMLGILDYDAGMDQDNAPERYRQMGELALLADSMEMADKALAYLESVAPNDFMTLNLRGKILLRRGKTEEAIAVWTKLRMAAMEGENKEHEKIARSNRDVAAMLDEKLRMPQDTPRRVEMTREAQNQLKGVPAHRKDMLEKADLEALVNQIDMENRRGLIDDMFRAAVDPVSFFAENRERLKNAGFNEAHDMLYASLLPYELKRQGKAAGIDWKEDPLEIAHFIQEISKGKYPCVLTDLDDFPTLEALKLAGRRIMESGEVLLDIDSGGDYYIIFIAPGDKADAIIAAADKCNIKIRLMEDVP